MVIKKNDPGAVRNIVNIIRDGGIAIAPCDTIYGIIGSSPGAAQAIREVKGRGEQKPFITLLPSPKKAVDYSVKVIPPDILSLWPGPLTLILRGMRDETAGFRVPEDGFLREILSQTSSLYSTSVNYAGKAPLWRINDIVDMFESRVDVIIDGGDLPGKTPSTVLDITKKPYMILRKGAHRLSPGVIERCE